MPLPTRRTTRQPIVMSRQSARLGESVKPSNKTKSAICFLCLFDGLRVPSIRRLIRKPKTFGHLPLRYFDPAFFSPESKDYLSEMYSKLFVGRYDCVVDPSVDTVKKILNSHSNQSSNQRVILHYFGYGVHPPTPQGVLFFFTDDRTRYMHMKIENYISECKAPLMLIFDCNYSGSLVKPIEDFKNSQKFNLLASMNKDDLIVFCSCSPDEPLPNSLDLPEDLFSLCLLNPFKTSLWWYKKRHTEVYKNVSLKEAKNNSFLKGFFEAILTAIAFDEIDKSLYEKLFTRDEVVSTISKGFLLSQHIMKSYYIKPVSIPSLPNTSNHELWSFYETCLDMVKANCEGINALILDLFISSYKNCPKKGAIPLFAFFLKQPESHLKVSSILLESLDILHFDRSWKYDGHIGDLLDYKEIGYSILQCKKPSYISLLLLSKIIVLSKHNPFDQQSSLLFSTSNDTEVMKAGMLSICVSFSKESHNSFHRFSQICAANALSCAPYSCILFGLLSQRAGPLLNIPGSTSYFVPLLDDPRPEVQASAAFALGHINSSNSIPKMTECLSSNNWIVRYEALVAIARIFDYGFVNDINCITQAVSIVKNDKNNTVQEAAATISQQLDRNLIKTGASGSYNIIIPESKLLDLLCQSVQTPNFVKRYNTYVFAGIS